MAGAEEVASSLSALETDVLLLTLRPCMVAPRGLAPRSSDRKSEILLLDDGATWSPARTFTWVSGREPESLIP